MSEVNGFKLVMDKELYEKAQPVKVDVSYMGFTVTSNLELGGGGGCSSGSCGTDGGAGGCAC